LQATSALLERVRAWIFAVELEQVEGHQVATGPLLRASAWRTAKKSETPSLSITAVELAIRFE
jgi:hypothetical protein